MGISEDISCDGSKKILNKKTQNRAIESDYKMVEQTIYLLAEGGVSAVTLESVGIRAGYSRGLVTRRYGSKEKLLIRVLNYLQDWLEENAKTATKDLHGIDAINNLILSVSEDIIINEVKYKAYFWLVFYGLESKSELNSYLLKVLKERESQNIKWLKEALVLEQLSRNSDIEMMADFIMMSMMGIVHKWMVDPNFNIELRLKQLVKIQLKIMFENSHQYYSVKFWGE
ncbi:TetR/AcrR family transcriptional regulator [Acinetobacter gerneri]|uniref:TetR/AcrR family transcriptional regulator n=1 Tax=Acinetobacter gerneri TaxID=202952 RepID=UPI003A8995BF